MKNRYHLLGWLRKKNPELLPGIFTVFFFIASLLPSIPLHAQNNSTPETENRLKKLAAKYFEQQDYVEAYPLYSQLVSLYPRDPNYNYRFGACLLYAKTDKNKAADYLEFAVQQGPVENLAYYYLGRALHLNYRFNEAIKSYEKFEDLATPAELKKFPVTHFIDMCENGRGLLSTLRGLDVLRKKELNFSDYLGAYDLTDNGGSLVSEPEEFKSKIDKEKKEDKFIYLIPDKSEAFFSSYGNSDKNGKDIYVVKRIAFGPWSAPENLGSVINTSYDEDYPIYDAPRHTLYFCSKGHNTMGGYDIFKSVYNDSSGTWSAPVNLAFPVNTPDDDILFVPDSLGLTAYFASTRSSRPGTIDVYKILLYFHPPDSVVVAGIAYTDAGKMPTSCTITVRDIKTNKVVKVDTASASGSYSFNLPNGGNYDFTVEASNHKTQSKPVVLPVERNMTAVKQDIAYNSSGNLLIISNLQGGGISQDSDYRLAYNYIQQQAQMNVNVDTTSTIQTLIAKNNSVEPNANTSVSLENGSANKQAAESTSSADTVQLKKDEEQLNTETTNATDYAGDKLAQALQMREQANDILNNQSANSNSGDNTDSAEYAVKLLEQSAVSEKKGMEAYRLAAVYKNEAEVKQLKIGRVENTSSAAEQDTNSIVKIKPGDLIREQAKEVEQDSLQTAQTNEDLSKEISGFQQQSQNFVNQAGQTTDSQQKVALLQQADDLSKSKDEKVQVLNENNFELHQLHGESVWLNTKARQADSAFKASSNNGSNATSNINPELQKEIDKYAVALNSDSSGNALANSPATGVTDSLGNKNGVSKPVVKNDLKYHYRKSAQNTPQTNNIVAVSTPSPQNTAINTSASPVSGNTTTGVSNGMSNTSTDTNQNTQAVNNNNVAATNGNTTTTTINNTSSKTNTDANQNVQVVNNNVAATNGNTTTTTINNTPSKTNADTNQNAQTTNNSNVAATNGNTTTAINNAPPNANANTNQNTQAVNNNIAVTNGNTTITAVGNTPSNTNVDTNQNAQVVNNNVAVTNGNTTTTAVGNAPSNTSTENSQNTPTAINNSSVSTSNGNNAPVSPQETNKISANQNTGASMPASIVAETTVPTNISPDTSLTTPPIVNLPASFGYYELITSHDALLNSIAEQRPIGSYSTGYSGNEQNITDSNVEYNDTVAVSLEQKSQNYFNAASALANVAEKVRNKARNERGKSRAASDNKADSLDNLVSELDLKGNENLAEANYSQYRANVNQITNNKSQNNISDTSEVATAKRLVKDADISYRKSLAERDRANYASIPADKETSINLAKQDLSTAVLIQQKAMHLYSRADSEQKAETSLASNQGANLQPEAKEVTASGENNASRSPAADTVPVPKTETVQNAENTQAESSNNISANSSAIPSNENNQSVTANENNNGNSSAGNLTAATPLSNDATNAVVSPRKAEAVTLSETVNVFEEVPSSPYSDANPIPIDKPLPEGIIFKVQVGAFRKPIPQDLFKGFEPIVGITAPRGFIRYSTGMFTKFDSARSALGKIRGMGYTDAFITAFYNGNRIAIREALAKLGISPPPVETVATVQTNNNSQNTGVPEPANTIASNENSKAAIISENTISPTETSLIDTATEAAKAIKDSLPPAAESFRNVKGLVFTVQVGSFSKRIGFNRLKKIKHLYIWTDKDGTIKYNSGTYKSIADAQAAKAIIVANTSVKDAFISAYYNGERISIAEARELLKNGSEPVTVQSPSAAANTTTKDTGNTAAAGAESVANSSNKNSTTGSMDSIPAGISGKINIVYSVRIASFKGEMPVNAANKILKYAGAGIEPRPENDGMTTYYAGKFPDYASAGALQKKLYNEGFHKASVVAYYNGKKISLQVARSITEK